MCGALKACQTPANRSTWISTASIARAEHDSTAIPAFLIRQLQPLCPLFSSPAFCFQSFAASFSETPGVGVPPHICPSLRFRRHMRHVAPLSPMASVDCAYFLSPRGCTYPHGTPPYVFRIPLVCGRPNLPPARRGGPFVFIFLRIAFPATSFFSQPSTLPGGGGGSRSLSNSVGDVRLHALEEKQSPDQHHSHAYG